MVDDDAELCQMAREYLALEGFDLDCVHDGARGLQAAQSGAHELMLLDVMLPQLGGMEVLRRLRSDGSALPVLMLTARGDAGDRIVGLEIGADDYLPKPFDERELVARIRAVLRRAGGLRKTPGILKIGDIELDTGARLARQGGKVLPLTSVEFELLAMLLQDAGNVVARDAIAREVLGRALLHFDRSIDTHISRLRRKLGPRADGAERIVTLRGVGYLYTR